MYIYIPAEIIKIAPKKVCIVGISLNKKYPMIIDQIIKEYSNSDTKDGEAIL